jgi:hypothetical protein
MPVLPLKETLRLWMLLLTVVLSDEMRSCASEIELMLSRRKYKARAPSRSRYGQTPGLVTLVCLLRACKVNARQIFSNVPEHSSSPSRLNRSQDF